MSTIILSTITGILLCLTTPGNTAFAGHTTYSPGDTTAIIRMIKENERKYKLQKSSSFKKINCTDSVEYTRWIRQFPGSPLCRSLRQFLKNNERV
jgi:hypothetical protein